MVICLTWIVFLLLSALPARADSTLTVIRNGQITRLSWDIIRPGNAEKSPISRDAALFGRFGLDISADSFKTGGFIAKSLAYRPVSWQRFYMKCGRLQNITSAGKMDDVAPLVYCAVSEKTEINQPEHIMRISLHTARRHGKPLLEVAFTASKADNKQNKFLHPIDEERVYCVETFLAFEGDTASFEYFINGVPAGRAAERYVYQKKFIDLQFRSASTYKGVFPLYVDEYAVSDQRVYGIPPVPVKKQLAVSGNRVTVAIDPFTSDYHNEKVSGIGWRLWNNDGLKWPLYETEDSDPAFFQNMRVPFPLDSGLYFWQARFCNVNGNYGYWSDMDTFSVVRALISPVKITGVSILSENRVKKVNRMVPGETYHLKIETDIPAGWMKKAAYFGAFLSHINYHQAHPANKGGRFLKERNFIFNIGFQPNAVDGPVRVYEKIEQSVHNIRLGPGEKGTYLFGHGAGCDVDTAKGTIYQKFILPAEAKEGEWLLTAFARCINDSISNIVRVPFLVETGTIATLFVVSSSVIISAVLGWVILLRRRRKRPLPENTAIQNEPEMQAIMEYIRNNLQSDISVDTVRKKLGLGIHRFHAMLGRHDFDSLPTLVNSIRVEKAKELLSGGNCPVNKAGYEVGFTDPGYFSVVFRKMTGLSPSEYKSKYSLKSL